MIEKRFLSLLLFITTISLSAQVKGIVKDNVTGKPIPFVNIWVENENIGTTTEENGTFSLDIKEEKVLVFSALGYDTKTIKSSNDFTFFLTKKPLQLNENVVENKKEEKKLKVGKYSNSKIKSFYGGGIRPKIFAKKIESNNEISEHPFLKEISFISLSEIENAKINLRFFKINPNGKPGDDILVENLIVEVKIGRNNNVVNIEKYNIKIPEEGLFIAFEWMIIDKNKFYYTNNNDSNTPLLNEKLYQPLLGFFYSEEQLIWEFKKGDWFIKEEERSKSKNNKKKYGELDIQLTLTN
ncbi:carboxypeptidase-like regulatory domain-containing protein [Flavobacterium sp.]|jgi:hypothetical protein|uniref:carboxypeptidase-like regulatory domain-containing protein n=1 Tax=Flavobacterium sp. TaxID=239 RepID=UPI002A8333BB|nr:carboxypeptidase-like regulatory domain-containing protein [Flavobacterium sp.]